MKFIIHLFYLNAKRTNERYSKILFLIIDTYCPYILDSKFKHRISSLTVNKYDHFKLKKFASSHCKYSF